MNERAQTGRPVGELEGLEHTADALVTKVRGITENAESLHLRILGTRPPRNGGVVGTDAPEPQAHVEVMRDRLMSIDAQLDLLNDLLRSLARGYWHEQH